MAMSHKKLAQKRTKKKLARKNKTHNTVMYVAKPVVEEKFRRDPLSGDTSIQL